jgi:hypothetical protein
MVEVIVFMAYKGRRKGICWHLGRTVDVIFNMADRNEGSK